MKTLPPYIIERLDVFEEKFAWIKEIYGDTSKDFKSFLLESLALQLETLAEGCEERGVKIHQELQSLPTDGYSLGKIAGKIALLSDLASSYREQAKIIRNKQ